MGARVVGPAGAARVPVCTSVARGVVLSAPTHSTAANWGRAIRTRRAGATGGLALAYPPRRAASILSRAGQTTPTSRASTCALGSISDGAVGYGPAIFLRTTSGSTQTTRPSRASTWSCRAARRPASPCSWRPRMFRLGPFEVFGPLRRVSGRLGRCGGWLLGRLLRSQC